MSVAVSSHVHIRHIRHVVFYERKKPRWPGSRLQLPHVRAINDTAFHGNAHNILCYPKPSDSIELNRDVGRN